MASEQQHPDRPDVPGSAGARRVLPAVPALTRRRVVRGGAVLGAAAWLGGGALASEAVAARGPGRLVVRRSALAPGRTVVLTAPHRFDLLGAPATTVAGIGLQVRARRRGGRWSAWRAVDGHDGHAPDGRRAAMSDPLWFGDADEVALRVRRRPARDVRLDLVAVPPGEKARAGRAAARAAAAGGLALPRAAVRASGAQAASRAAPTIIPRTAWATGVRTKGSPSYGAVQVAFVHHTVNGNDYGPGDSAGIVRAIAEYHIGSNGWNDIGYNFLVDRYGQIFEGREGGVDRPVIGAQAVGWNSVSTGIAIIGTFEGEAAPDAALDAVASLIGWKLPLHGVPTAGAVALVSSGGSGNRWPAGRTVQMSRISGHQDGCSTDCPGTTLYGQLPALRARVGDVSPAPAAAGPVLSITAPESAVGYGTTLTASGVLTVGGAPVGGARVTLQKKSPKGAWVPMATGTTGADGTWSIGIPFRSATQIRATAAGTTSNAVTPALDPGLTLSQPARRARRGGTVRARGRARGVSEVKITLRRKQGGRYVVVSSKTVKVRGGRYSGTLPVRRSGLHNVSVSARSGRTFTTPRRYVRAS
ncbi:N-acetylmuramoyl-L-alanine amidase [Patulibacter sp. SYSU D01012]|uniref:N-acetylmuramoyl-L-alanine amidase n=1 Tax=Patulibacter sp. SYSU D01012 TaxID=2817381 RepID=UPI001B3049B6|nr:N-acetylmuramoyl-L-alanine amidase [Patulibacter sp. SYSU D01012]